MRHFLAALAIATALSTPAAAQVIEADLQQAMQTPLLSLSVQETVEAPADIVRLQFGVMTRNESAAVAMSEATETIKRIREALVASGAEAKDIDTRSINLGRWTEYDRVNQKQLDLGFQASSSVEVEAPLTIDVLRMIDRATAAGANNVSGPYFDYDDRLGLRAEARRRAVARAKAEAAEYARLWGFSRATLVDIQTGPSTNRDAIMITGSRVGPPPPPPPPPEPERDGYAPAVAGDIGESVYLGLTFALVR
ncbi:SIMPL domain-containing protein [Sphingomicrobium arenosum]|uniref:SIMPL domain-containing protein n=1 Tax=Sphingomicrobium arenosum TaxID=2233861 RepID=UPI0022401703|nr:SIMPL domain-containing protein [Sphingomicrobium arenosum]